MFKKYVAYLVVCMAVFLPPAHRLKNYLFAGCRSVETTGDRTKV